MSRTDAHRPGWVQQFDPDVPASIRHDHRSGRCVEETFEYARWNATQRFGGGRHYYGRCDKYEAYAYECPQDHEAVPTRTGCYTVWSAYNSWQSAMRDYERDKYWFYSAPRWRFPEHEHTRYKFHADWSCETCVAQPEVPTCDLYFDRGYGWQVSKVYGDHPNREDRRLYYNGPERRRVRDVLHGAARDWNANGDTDVEPDTRQHRHSVAWLMW